MTEADKTVCLNCKYLENREGPRHWCHYGNFYVSDPAGQACAEFRSINPPPALYQVFWEDVTREFFC